MSADTRSPAARRLLFAAIFLVALIPLFSTPVIPMIDYYNHFARYYVLSHVASDGYLAQNYAPHWVILPNIGMDALGTAVSSVMSPLLAAKSLIVLALAVQYGGMLYFTRQLTGRVSIITALLTVPLLYSFIFTWGFANFLLGLGLVFWGGGWWLATRRRLALAIPVACILALAIFLTHGVAFALYGLLLGGLELGFFLTSPRRSVAALARSMAALAVQAIAPVAMFALSPTSSNPQGLTNADEAVENLANNGALQVRILELIEYRLATIVQVADGPSLLFDLVCLGLVLAAVTVLALRRVVTIPTVAWPALFIAFLLVIVTPPTLLGVGYVADRMPLFLAMLLVASLNVTAAKTRIDLACVGVLGALALVRLVALVSEWQPYRQDLEAFQSVSAQLPPRSMVAFVNLANDRRLDAGARCEMYGPLLIPLAGHASPIFAYGAQQPITIIGPLKTAISALPPPSGSRSGLLRGRRRFAAISAAANFDYALVCAPERLQAPLPASATQVARAGRFALFRLAKTSRPLR